MVILPGTGGEGVDRMASGIVEEWKVGAGKGGRGLLFLLSLEDKAVRFEVTYASEGVYTDAFISYIEHEQMVPFFEQGRVGDGVEATLELIVARAREHIAKGGYDPAVNEPNHDLDFQAGGAGAHSHVDVGRNMLTASTGVRAAQRGSFTAGETPEAAFLSYLQRDHQRVTDPDLGLFTPATRAMMARWTITNAQLDNEYRTYSGRPYQIITEGDRAVVRFAVDERTLSPFFLSRAPEGWQIDLTLMGEVVRFNHRNEWHFASQDHPYMFAFRDCVFDANGYPFLRKNAVHGPRAFLGISYYWHNYQGQGVLVYRVIPGAAAEMAGVKVGDYVMTYNEHPLYKPRDLDMQLASSRPGDTVELEIVRGADEQALTINLGNEG